MKIKKKHLINLLVRESKLGAEWGPLTKKGAKNIVDMLK